MSQHNPICQLTIYRKAEQLLRLVENFSPLWLHQLPEMYQDHTIVMLDSITQMKK